MTTGTFFLILPYLIICAILFAWWKQRTRSPAPGNSNDVLALAIEQLESGFVLYGADGRLALCNQKFRDLYPEIADVLIPGTTYSDIVRTFHRRRRAIEHFTDEERAALRLKGEKPSHVWATEDEYVAMRCAEHSSPQQYDYEWVERGRHYLISDRILSNGVVVGLRVDITERKKIEQALQQSERFIRAVADGLPGMVAYWTPDLRCAFSNRAYYDWFGLMPEQMRGITMLELKGQALFDADAPYVQGALRGESQGFERKLTKTDGSIGHTWTQYIPDIVAGQVQGFFVLVSEITRIKQAEQEQARIKALLEASQSLARVGGIELNMQSNEVYMTDQVLHMFELTRQQQLEQFGTATEYVKNLFRYVAPEARDRLEQIVSLALQDNSTFDVELPMQTTQGRPLWVHVKNSIAMDQGQVARRLTVLQDITERREAENALKRSEELLRQITSQIPGMVYRLLVRRDGTREYSYVSPGVEALFGISVEQVMQDGNLLYAHIHPEDLSRINAQSGDMIRTGGPVSAEFRILLDDGTVKWIQMNSSTVEQADEGSIRTGVAIDITARKLAEAALHEQDEMWKLALESTGDGVWDWHIDTGIEIFSRRCKEMYGYGDDEIESRYEEFDDRTHPDDVAQMERDRQAHFDGLTPAYVNEHRVRCKDGSWKWIQSRGMVISRDASGKPLRMIGTHTDITSRKASEALIWQQANFDALTALPNRRMLRQRLEQDIEYCRREKLRIALLFIDLDHFKEVNDTLGHDRGDQLLVQAATRIRECLRAGDTVARMGGDEFTVVLHALTDENQVEPIVQSILRALSSAFHLGTEQAFVSASIGVTIFPDDGTEIEDLLRHADQALYVAKDSGRNRSSYFTPALQEAAQNRVRLANDLRHALQENQLEVYYQPVIELASGEIRKAEALLRWKHPVRGMVSPAVFIPIAEASGMIVDIGDWVFRQAAAQVQRLRSQFHPDFQISINKSPVQFHAEGNTQQAWLQHLEQLGLPGSSVVLEITEGLLLDASSGVNAQLLELRDAGVGVSLDDFGTGYSSLSYLQKYDIDYIKIDQSFVRNLTPDARDMALCNAIIVMAHELGMQVVAEGVETEQQRDLLNAAGCDFGQGYLFAHPMPASELEALIAAASA